MKNKKYKIEIEEGKSTTKEINLFDTIYPHTLVKEKIAPGTKGGFIIQLISRENCFYELNWEEKNKKPKNLEFSWEVIGENQEEKIEKISNIQGKIEKNKIVTIQINWIWDYEKTKEDNIQDTEDGMNLQQYNFCFYLIGK